MALGSNRGGGFGPPWILIKSVQQAAGGVPLEPKEFVDKPHDIPAWDAPQKALSPNPEPIPQLSAPDPR